LRDTGTFQRPAASSAQLHKSIDTAGPIAYIKFLGDSVKFNEEGDIPSKERESFRLLPRQRGGPHFLPIPGYISIVRKHGLNVFNQLIKCFDYNNTALSIVHDAERTCT
jgi:hypothetical protein